MKTIVLLPSVSRAENFPKDRETIIRNAAMTMARTVVARVESTP